MFDVLVYLFENYAGPNEAPKDPDELRARLADAGFEGDEIDEALSWLDTLRNGEALSPSWRIPPAGGSVRIFTEDEALREALIDRALEFGATPLDPDDFKVLALMVLWQHERELDPLVVDELLRVEDDEDAEPPRLH
jgi:Smg protein